MPTGGIALEKTRKEQAALDITIFGAPKIIFIIEKAEAVAKYGIFEGRKNFDNINAKRPGYNRWQTNRTNIFVPESHPLEGGAGEKRHTTRLASRRATAQDGR